MTHLDNILPYLKSVPTPENALVSDIDRARHCNLSQIQVEDVCLKVMRMLSNALPVEGVALKSR